MCVKRYFRSASAALATAFILASCAVAGGQNNNCSDTDTVKVDQTETAQADVYQEVDTAGMTIATRYNPPKGFTRIPTDEWGQWLRNFPVHPYGYICHEYDGAPTRNYPQGAVLKLDLIGQDLQQCADACIRLRAEYLWQTGQWEKIHFRFVSGQNCDYNRWRRENGMSESRADFRKYLFRVFSYANSASLAKETDRVPLDSVRVGDMLLRGGFPGHVALVVDVARDGNGNTALLFAQSWMPAQEMEIYPRISGPNESMWHIVNENTDCIYVGITFELTEFRRFAAK